ncbi:MAG: ABC transporter permease, partial [Rhodospirillum sp.]|nr:ABC transporter permease [Rhodospirillum sp.]
MTPVIQRIERIGQATTSGVQELGHAAMLFLESLFWVAFGRLHRQPVRLSAIIRQAMEIGITALPIILVMNGTIGMMLAIQGIYTLRTFGAEQQVVFGVAFSVVREFAPLITGILVAGRSGSSLAARLGTMKINQEIDALTVMGIDPTRFLVAPALIASLVMVPLMTFMAMGIAM